MYRPITSLMDPPAPHMVGDGFRVHTLFPSPAGIDMSPFYLLDYNARISFSARAEPRGVGIHPHRGFETVTISYHGAVAHHDSAGNSGVIYPGDVQWMTAARGILHKEYHDKEFTRKGGDFQMVQLWVNLPAKDKMSAPKYQSLSRDLHGKFMVANNGGVVEVIAGNYMGTKGPAFTFTPIELYNARLNKGGSIVLDLPANHNVGILAIDGAGRINEKETIESDQFSYFKPGAGQIAIEATEDAVFLILSGEPINEPIVQYGPFLMNTQEEIQQALADYNEGKFGFLE